MISRGNAVTTPDQSARSQNNGKKKCNHHTQTNQQGHRIMAGGDAVTITRPISSVIEEWQDEMQSPHPGLSARSQNNGKEVQSPHPDKSARSQNNGRRRCNHHTQANQQCHRRMAGRNAVTTPRPISKVTE